MNLSKVSFGVVGALDRSILRTLAPRIEAAGFRTIWLNDSSEGDSLEGLSVVAEVTSTLKLATGVIPLDRRPAASIAASLRELQLPEDRLVLGIGTGLPKGGLARVSASIDELRDVTKVPIVIGALGPKIRKLGAEKADGLLLSWLTPNSAAEAMSDLKRDSAAVGRSDVRGVLYTRTAVDPVGLRAMVPESARYQSIPSYAANLERIGAKAIDTTIYEKDVDRLSYRVEQYTQHVDEIVLRAITGETTIDGYLRLIDLAAEAGSAS